VRNRKIKRKQKTIAAQWDVEDIDIEEHENDLYAQLQTNRVIPYQCSHNMLIILILIKLTC
jgi:hypothetical protein